MDTPDYLALVTGALQKVQELQEQRESLDAEIMKLEQFISATANLLSDDHRDMAMKAMELNQDLQRVRDSGLTNAVRTVLATAKDWLTVAQVRDRLIALGFNFSLYSTNPLASVSTTLRRMKSEEVETRNTPDGATAYRRKRLAERVKEAQENKEFWTMQEALSGKGVAVPGRSLTPPPRLTDVIEDSLKAALKKK